MSRSSPLNNPSAASLVSGGNPISDPSQRQVDASVLDYLVTGITHTLTHSSNIALARLKKREKELIEAGYIAPPPPRKERATGSSARDSTNSIVSVSRATSASSPGELIDEGDDAARQRLENIGVIVGGNLAERLVRNRSTRFSEPLETIKFLCKDVWTAIWDKPVDNLRTNHRGVYVLQDNSFKPLLRISSPQGSAESLRHARLYLAYPAGLIKGALQRLGIPGVVIPEITTLPQCTFQVKLAKTL